MPGAGADSLRRERAGQVAYWRNRLLVGVVLTLPLVLLGYAPMVAPATFGHAAWVGWVMFALAGALQTYLGGPYYVGAWQRLRQRSTNMDTLIALGTSTAFAYSVFQLVAGDARQAHYFMDAGIILTLITLGKYLDVRSKGVAGAAVERLLDLSPRAARRRPGRRRGRGPARRRPPRRPRPRPPGGDGRRRRAGARRRIECR